MKNIAASVRAKLTNIAKKENIGFQLVCTRYFHERLLYRLSVSGYAQNFILKGGGLLYYYNRFKSRSTLDIDLLGRSLSNETKVLSEAFVEICTISVPEDGVLFNKEGIVAERINEQANYSGVRLHIMAHLGQIKQRVQIDVGFGDVISPKPVLIEYPVLLDQSPIPTLNAYTKESVIAEKFQTMIELSGLNSRMKDFYDVYSILLTNKIDDDDLELAIRQTCIVRNTKYVHNHLLFSEYFIDDAKQKQWKSFLKKALLPENIQLEEVLNFIIQRLKPIWENLNDGSHK